MLHKGATKNNLEDMIQRCLKVQKEKKNAMIFV
jgi:hypothetical protein